MDTRQLSPQTYAAIARQAADAATAADDHALNAVCHSRAGNTARLETAMHATHAHAVDAERYATYAGNWEADSVPAGTVANFASMAIDAAVRAQAAAGVDTTATSLRAALARPLTAEEQAEQDRAQHAEEERREAEERAATGMDAANRQQDGMNRHYAQSAVPALGWTTGHARVMEAAATGRLYERDGQPRQARQEGARDGGRKVSRDRTRALHAAGFLVAVDQADGTRALTPSAMGTVALALVRLHPEGLYGTDALAYDVRFRRAARHHKRSDDKKAAARRLPALDGSALRLYRQPVTLAEQEAAAQTPATEEHSARCPCCGLHKVTTSGVLPVHKPTRTAAQDCPGSGLRPATDTPRPAAKAAPEHAAPSRRPLADVAGGPAQQAAYAARRARYVDIERLQLRPAGRATVRLDFPYATGHGPQRADAANAIAARFGVHARQLDRAGRALRITGPAEHVARYAAALPNILDHAEQIASWAARMYGECSRRPQYAEHFNAMTDAGRRAAAAYFRALAFLRIVQVLTGPKPATVPEVDPALPLWEQAATLGGVLAEYGWVDIRDAYDPATAQQLLNGAEQATAPAAPRPIATADGEQLALFAPTAPVAAGPVVVIPCSGAKLDRPAPAGELYTGSLHALARRTADALTAQGGTVLILSALHGLLTLDQVVAPYEQRMTDPGAIGTDSLRAQAAALDLADATDVILLTPAAYTAAAAAVWPHAATPLAHQGIGRQRGTLAALRNDPAQYAPAA